MNPQNVLKLSIKADDFNPKTDEPKYMIADYYSVSGDPAPEPEVDDESTKHVSTIVAQTMDEEGYLSDADMPESIEVGPTYYFKCIDPKDRVFIEAVWRVNIDGLEEGDPLEKLVHLTKVSGDTISLKIAKSSKLKGKTLIISVSDNNEDYYSSVKLEVAADET